MHGSVKEDRKYLLKVRPNTSTDVLHTFLHVYISHVFHKAKKQFCSYLRFWNRELNKIIVKINYRVGSV